MFYYNITRIGEKKTLPTEITFEDVIAGTYSNTSTFESEQTGTITRKSKVKEYPNISIGEIYKFIAKYERLYDADINTLFKSYKIPKKTGGWRPIDDPIPELRKAYAEMMDLFKKICGGPMYTNAAYAYVKGRSALDCAKLHYNRQGNFTLHIDFHNFFGGISKEFFIEQVKRINPLSAWAEEEGFWNFIDLCFLRNGLPQGSLMSCWLSNLVMIPFDYMMMHYCYDHNLTYTRYADDMYISGRTSFDWREIEKKVVDWISNSSANFTLNAEKTHYGAASGRNYILGVLVTKNYGLKIGNEKVRYMKAGVWNLLITVKHNKLEEYHKSDISELLGQLNWFKQVDPKYTEVWVSRLERKAGITLAEVKNKYGV